MLLFPIYAVLVVWGSLRWRRRPTGLVWVASTALGLPTAVYWGYTSVESLITGDTIGLEFRFILVAYAVALLALGLMSWIVPTSPRADRDIRRPCKGCGYELAAIELHAETVCPECGLTDAPRRPTNPVAEAQRAKFGSAPRPAPGQSYQEYKHRGPQGE
ncbi:MAG: hypothetical protein AAGB51_14745 [Planctomycetota bacterium]